MIVCMCVFMQFLSILLALYTGVGTGGSNDNCPTFENYPLNCFQQKLNHVSSPTRINEGSSLSTPLSSLPELGVLFILSVFIVSVLVRRNPWLIFGICVWLLS